MKTYLLLIGCSQRKVSTPGMLPALERYDGPTYRTLRKARKSAVLATSGKNVNPVVHRHGEAHTGFIPLIRNEQQAHFSARHYGCTPNIHTLIISAKHGLIGCQKPIEAYDQRMTPARAAELRRPIQSRLKACLAAVAYDEIFINLGKTYMKTLEDFHWSLLPTLEASGGIGQKTAQMKAWLQRIAPGESYEIH